MCIVCSITGAIKRAIRRHRARSKKMRQFGYKPHALMFPESRLNRNVQTGIATGNHPGVRHE